jgi:putative component of toxin-antitoxin plasmid stabilization module
VTGTEQDWFRKWRDALDPVSQRIVDRRLQQVADGNFGDWRKLSSIDAA